MATLNAGQSVSFTLYANTTLVVNGTGSLVNFSSLDKTPISFVGRSEYGPLDHDCSVSINATSTTSYSLEISGDWVGQTNLVIINGGVAGSKSGWIPKSPFSERLAYALDSGSTTTTFSIDISDDGITSLAQAFTGSYASSSLIEVTPPLSFSNPLAKYYQVNILTGGPITFIRGV